MFFRPFWYRPRLSFQIMEIIADLRKFMYVFPMAVSRHSLITLCRPSCHFPNHYLLIFSILLCMLFPKELLISNACLAIPISIVSTLFSCMKVIWKCALDSIWLTPAWRVYFETWRIVTFCDLLCAICTGVSLRFCWHSCHCRLRLLSLSDLWLLLFVKLEKQFFLLLG